MLFTRDYSPPLCDIRKGFAVDKNSHVSRLFLQKKTPYTTKVSGSAKKCASVDQLHFHKFTNHTFS